MTFKRCPGSTAFAQPKIELVRCPHCGEDTEVWTDEAEGKCAKCGCSVCRTTTQSCIDWCKYARECLGDEAHKRYQEMKVRLRKEALLKAAQHSLVDERDRRRTQARIELAEQLLRRETAADPNAVIAAAALIDVERVGSQGSKQDGAPPGRNGTAPHAAEILRELGYPEGFINEVCGILCRLQAPHGGVSVNLRIVLEADRLVDGASA